MIFAKDLTRIFPLKKIKKKKRDIDREQIIIFIKYKFSTPSTDIFSFSGTGKEIGIFSMSIRLSIFLSSICLLTEFPNLVLSSSSLISFSNSLSLASTSSISSDSFLNLSKDLYKYFYDFRNTTYVK